MCSMCSTICNSQDLPLQHLYDDVTAAETTAFRHTNLEGISRKGLGQGIGEMQHVLLQRHVSPEGLSESQTDLL